MACLATNLDISTASLSVPRNAPSSSAIKKFCVNLLIPIPSVIVSKGFFNLRPSASSLVYITPLVTLLNRPEPGGSMRKHLTFGFFSCGRRGRELAQFPQQNITHGFGRIRNAVFTFRNLETPATVPPVPAAAIKASMHPPVCSQISGPVPS